MERSFVTAVPEPRFWRVAVVDARITITTGPLHSTGTTRHIDCPTGAAALRTAEALAAQRTRDGFREVSGAPTMSVEQERILLADAPDAWLVFADDLQETGERARGELISLQVRAARRERGAIGRARAYLRDHFDELVGPEVAALNRQVFLDWRFGYARTARVWSSPHSPPLTDAIEPVLRSPASRFLQRFELGSPSGEGRYDAALRVLAKATWPAHLDSLVLGNFDVVSARLTESAWPRLESLSALAPVAGRLRLLDVRAVLNTFGTRLRFPRLEHLALRPSALDARLLADLRTLEAPELRELVLDCDRAPSAGWAGWASLLHQWALVTRLGTLDLSRQAGALELLEALGEVAKRLRRIELFDAVGLADAGRLIALAPSLREAELVVGPAPRLASKLAPYFPKLTIEEREKTKQPVALTKQQKMRRAIALRRSEQEGEW